jgi:hypothetical protein
MTQDPEQFERLARASESAETLSRRVREAHQTACHGNPALEILLRDLIAEVQRVRNRLGEIEVCFRPDLVA